MAITKEQVKVAARRARDGKIVVTDPFGDWSGTVVRITETGVTIRTESGGHRGMSLATVTAVRTEQVAWRGRVPQARAW